MPIERLQTPRLSIPLDEETYERLGRCFNIYGSKTAFWKAIVEDLLPALEKYGAAFIVAVIEKRFSLTDIYVKRSESDGSEESEIKLSRLKPSRPAKTDT